MLLSLSGASDAGFSCGSYREILSEQQVPSESQTLGSTNTTTALSLFPYAIVENPSSLRELP